MTHWQWCCAIALVIGLWMARVASAADQEALFTEGTLTSMDLNHENPTITLRLSNGTPMVLKLGRFGEWNSLEVGLPVKLRYTEQGGVNTLESIQIIRPNQGTSASQDTATSSISSSSTVVEESSVPSQLSGENKKNEAAPSGTEKKQQKKKKR